MGKAATTFRNLQPGAVISIGQARLVIQAGGPVTIAVFDAGTAHVRVDRRPPGRDSALDFSREKRDPDI